MKPGLTISIVVHAGVLLGSLVAFAAKPIQAPPVDSLPVEFVSAKEFSEMTAGAKNAQPAEKPLPPAEKVAEPKPVKQLAPKIADKPEITTATNPEKPPPPEPKPPEKEKKPPEPKIDPIAEQLKKEEPKKPPPKKPPQPTRKFDANQVAALLDKREPQRQLATAETITGAPSLGTSSGNSARLSQSEIDALRAKLISLWNPPAGMTRPEDFIIRIRIRLGKDGRLSSPPMVLTSGQGTLFDATRDSAVRAVFRGQPYDMLSPSTYEVWKDMEINFDPRDLARG